MSKELSATSWETFKGGAKTFSLAARFFDRALLDSTAKLYFWCRHCDDLIDEDPGDVEVNLSELRRLTELACSEFGGSLPPPFEALREVMRDHKVPAVYVLDLLDGMAMDAFHRPVEDVSELELYSYRVASTVGLMMTHVMGLYDEEALTEAAHLGIAMQLTNIARDISEDHARGRVYLPACWLREAGLSAECLMIAEKRDALFIVARKLITHAETFYDSGVKGIEYLPLRPAVAITIALFLYREIGRRIIARGPSALDGRMVVPMRRKMVLLFLALAHVLKSIPARISQKKTPVPIQKVWRLT